MNIQRHATNVLGRDFVVGDLHGERAWLDERLGLLAFDSRRDRLFSVGDLIDRGPDSGGVLSLLDEPWFFPVMGNHEALMVAADTSPGAKRDWVRNGGGWAAALDEASLRHWRVRLEALPGLRIVGEGATRFHVVHAELTDSIGMALSDADVDGPARFRKLRAERLLWARTLAGRYSKAFSGKSPPCAVASGLSLTFCGHTPVLQPGLQESHYFIDGGAGSASLLPPDWPVALHVLEVGPILADFRRLGSVSDD